MAKKLSRNCRTVGKKAVLSSIASKSTKKKGSARTTKASSILCSHRTPTQLHASTYALKRS